MSAPPPSLSSRSRVVPMVIRANPGSFTGIASNPLDRLCDLIVPWNVLTSEERPTGTGSNSTGPMPCAKLPDIFSSANHYVDCWQPLLIEEIKASILASLAGNTKPSHWRGGVANAILTDTPAVASSSAKQAPSVRMQVEFTPSNIGSGKAAGSTGNGDVNDSNRRDAPMSMDLVLLSNHKLYSPIIPSSGSGSDRNNKLPPDLMGALAVVLSSNRSEGTQVKVDRSFVFNMLLANGKKSGEIIDRSDGKGPNSLIGIASLPKSVRSKAVRLHYVILDSLTSSWREFMALHDVFSTSPLMSQVLAEAVYMPMPATPSESGGPYCEHPNHQQDFVAIKRLSAKYQQQLNRKFNYSQIRAIEASMSDEGFTLVQGPPGSGKTTTVIGILNSIHVREYNKYYDLALEAILGEEGFRCRQSNDSESWLRLIANLARAKPHILVAAPSNVAVDNIIQRILESGFMDGGGTKYKPNILRVGGGKSPRVKIVSLEETLEQEMQSSVSQSTSTNSGISRGSMDLLRSQLVPEIRKLITLQSYLLNLRTAYLTHPLPAGWEVRVNLETSLPYWVDHINKAASANPPPAIGLSKPATAFANGDYPTLSALPEFAIHSASLTQVLDHIDKLNTIISRQKLKAKIHDSSSHSSVRQAIECSIIDGAHIVFTTLNSSGHPSLESTEFCVTIIDEAAQCVEPSILIPLRRGCKKCVMVGDPQQLPATIFADNIRRLGYDRSLFERLASVGHPVIMLDTQYRMTPVISKFPSEMFYDGKLMDGANVCHDNYCPSYLDATLTDKELQQKTISISAALTLTTAPATVESNGSNDGNKVPSFVFFNMHNTRDCLMGESTEGTAAATASGVGSSSMTTSLSRKNPEEAKFCVNLLKALLSLSSEAKLSLGSVGVITPYAEQVAELRRYLHRAGMVPSNGSTAYDLEVNTVDGFQGQEKNIIIISTVRSNDQGQIGFLSNPRRLNVSITRAKYGLFVVGNAETLSSNRHWKGLVRYAQSLGTLWSVDSAEGNMRDLIAWNQDRRGQYVEAYRSGVSAAVNSFLNPQPSVPPGNDQEAALSGYDVPIVGDHGSSGDKRSAKKPASALLAGYLKKQKPNQQKHSELEEGEEED